ncbi:MAG: SRPBCC domain-containing protein [Solirubrobacteraceae bacterium]
MATARRTRKLSVSPEQVWQVVEDPHHMPRWWPGVRRVEGVEDNRFTQVFMTKKGRAVRADHLVVAVEPPGPGGDPPGQISWEQEIQGTPFERVLSESITEVRLEAANGGTLVTITQTQKLRGYSRTGGMLLRRATRKKLDEALEGLAHVT